MITPEKEIIMKESTFSQWLHTLYYLILFLPNTFVHEPGFKLGSYMNWQICLLVWLPALLLFFICNVLVDASSRMCIVFHNLGYAGGRPRMFWNIFFFFFFGNIFFRCFLYMYSLVKRKLSIFNVDFIWMKTSPHQDLLQPIYCIGYGYMFGQWDAIL